MSQDTSANAKKRQADSELTQDADKNKKWKPDLTSSSSSSSGEESESYSSDSGGALSESASPSDSSSSESEEDSSDYSSGSSDEGETQTNVTDFDVCEARYHLLYDREHVNLAPEKRAAYEAIVDASIYGPMKRTSFELGTADRYDLFSAYASALLNRALPEPSTITINQLHSMIAILKF